MLRLLLIAVLSLGPVVCGGRAGAPAEDELQRPVGPGPVPADDFRTDGVQAPEPRRGGRLTVHVATRPLHLNTVIESSADARRILEEVHARLLERNWETWELEPSLASSVDVADRVVLAVPEGSEPRDAIGGAARLEPPEQGWTVSRRIPGRDVGTIQRFEDDQVERVEPDSVYTFHLRDDVRWHDGHPFDARDVVFTLDTYLNPLVQAEHARHRFERLVRYEALDEHTVRVVFDHRYFLALDLFEDDFTILPSHLYDLLDPDNPEYDPDASPERRAEFIHRNPANERWVGLGPYRVTRFSDQVIEAERVEDWFDPEHAGWVDTIRWRIVPDDNASKQALLAGELDFYGRLRSRELLGDFCRQSAFADHYEKGTYYTPQMSYVAWNLRRPLFRDERVRRALAHTFDWQEFIDTIGSGMGQAVTATWYCFSPDYDRTLEPYPFDLDRAEELLAEAGWIDRDGDGWLDRGGERFAFDYLYAEADAAMRLVGVKLKENLERIGIEMTLVGRDFAMRQEIVGQRDFDAVAGSWILGPETDPVGLWHSRGADLPRSNNQTGWKDEETDRLIEAIQTELDDGARRELFHRLQRRLYAAQPMMFGCVFPTKFAVSKRVHGVQRFYLDPGYSLRRWYVDPEPGAADDDR